MRVVVAALVVAGAAAVSTEASAVYLKATPQIAHRGQVVTLSGNAKPCPVGDTVTIISHAFSAAHTFAGVPAVFATVRTGGAFHARTRIPLHRRPARYGITARCGGGNLGVLAHIRVVP